MEIGTLEASALVSALVSGGFTPRISDGEFIDQTRVIPVLHESTKTPVDIVERCLTRAARARKPERPAR